MIITTMEPLDSNDFHPQPLSRFSSLLNFDRISLQVKNLLTHWKIRSDKLHSFGKIMSNVFSLLYLEMCLRSQFLNLLIEKVLFGRCGS